LRIARIASDVLGAIDPVLEIDSRGSDLPFDGSQTMGQAERGQSRKQQGGEGVAREKKGRLDEENAGNHGSCRETSVDCQSEHGIGGNPLFLRYQVGD